MAGIRVDKPLGPNWEYSLDQAVWQTSRVFLVQPDGAPFVAGTTYTVYCRNQVDNTRAVNSIIFGDPKNSTSDLVTIQVALRNGNVTDIVPHFQSGLMADLPEAPDNQLIQRVGVGADGTFYLLDSSPLDELDTTQKKDQFLRDLFNAMSEQTHLVLCQKIASCPALPVTIAPAFDQFDFFEFVPNESGQLPPVFDQFDFFEFVPDGVMVVVPPTLDPLYRVRLDSNNCGVNGSYGTLDGWVADINHPNQAPSVRIKRDGVFRADVVATIERPDVRDYLIAQGLIPAGSTFATYGYRYPKLQTDSDGQAHEWRVYGGTSNTEAISDTGAQNTVTCGSASPTITQQVIGGVISLYEGEDGTVFVTNNYSSGPSGPYIGQGVFSVEGAYPDGVTITMGANATALIHVPANCVTDDVTRPLLFTFPDERVIRQNFTFKNIATADPSANPPSHDWFDLHGNDFSVALGSDPANWAPGYVPIRGSYNWGNGTLCQTGNIQNTTPLLFKGYNSVNAYNRDVAIAKVKSSALASTQSWVGIGLRFEETGFQGYSLFVDNTSTIGLVHHGVRIGPTVAFTTELNVWYWQKMSYQETANNTAKISGKIWKAGEPEPADWLVVWADQPRENGYPALFGGSLGAVACFDDWYDGNLLATPPNVATGGDASIGSVAIWRENNDQVWFLYKSNQAGNQGLEDNWPAGTQNVQGNTTDFLPALYNTGQRPAGYESYQYLDGYSTMSAGMLSALESPSTLTIRKSAGKALVLTLQFTAKNLAKGEVRTLYTL